MAVNIIDYTVNRATSLLDDVAIVYNSDKRLMRFYRHVKLAGPNGIGQRELTRKMNYKVAEINELYKELKARGLVTLEVQTQPNKGAKGRSINTTVYKIVDESKQEGDVSV